MDAIHGYAPDSTPLFFIQVRVERDAAAAADGAGMRGWCASASCQAAVRRAGLHLLPRLLCVLLAAGWRPGQAGHVLG
jgi:hypothetical protein